MPPTAKKPTEPTTGPTLASALLEFQTRMPKVNKGNTATVPTKAGGQYKYTYADLADVTDAAVPLLAQLGLVFSSQPRRFEDGSYALVGVLRHVPSGERDEGMLPLNGRSAQELGSSITYNRRYLLGCMTGIVTDDDVDAAGVVNEPVRGERPAAPVDPLERARHRALAVWHAKHGDGPDSWDRFVGAFAQTHEGLNPGDATTEQLTSWADAYEAGELQ